jgi:hypothetical protein
MRSIAHGEIEAPPDGAGGGEVSMADLFSPVLFFLDVDVSVEEDMAALQFAPKMWYSSCSSFDLLYASFMSDAQT